MMDTTDNFAPAATTTTTAQQQVDTTLPVYVGTYLFTTEAGYPDVVPISYSPNEDHVIKHTVMVMFTVAGIKQPNPEQNWVDFVYGWPELPNTDVPSSTGKILVFAPDQADDVAELYARFRVPYDQTRFVILLYDKVPVDGIPLAHRKLLGVFAITKSKATVHDMIDRFTAADATLAAGEIKPENIGDYMSDGI